MAARQLRVQAVKAPRSSVFLMVSDGERVRVRSRMGRAARTRFGQHPGPVAARNGWPGAGGSSLPVSAPSGSVSQPCDTLTNSVRQLWRGAKAPIRSGGGSGRRRQRPSTTSVVVDGGSRLELGHDVDRQIIIFESVVVSALDPGDGSVVGHEGAGAEGRGRFPLRGGPDPWWWAKGELRVHPASGGRSRRVDRPARRRDRPGTGVGRREARRGVPAAFCSITSCAALTERRTRGQVERRFPAVTGPGQVWSCPDGLQGCRPGPAPSAFVPAGGAVVRLGVTVSSWFSGAWRGVDVGVAVRRTRSDGCPQTPTRSLPQHICGSGSGTRAHLVAGGKDQPRSILRSRGTGGRDRGMLASAPRWHGARDVGRPLRRIVVGSGAPRTET